MSTPQEDFDETFQQYKQKWLEGNKLMLATHDYLSKERGTYLYNTINEYGIKATQTEIDHMTDTSNPTPVGYLVEYAIKHYLKYLFKQSDHVKKYEILKNIFDYPSDISSRLTNHEEFDFEVKQSAERYFDNFKLCIPIKDPDIKIIRHLGGFEGWQLINSIPELRDLSNESLNYLLNWAWKNPPNNTYRVLLDQINNELSEIIARKSNKYSLRLAGVAVCISVLAAGLSGWSSHQDNEGDKKWRRDAETWSSNEVQATKNLEINLKSSVDQKSDLLIEAFKEMQSTLTPVQKEK